MVGVNKEMDGLRADLSKPLLTQMTKDKFILYIIVAHLAHIGNPFVLRL